MNLWQVSDEYYESGTGNPKDDLLDYGPSFKGLPMWEQLGKIEDSAELKGTIKAKKYKPVKTVVTDDGKKFVLNCKQAGKIKELVSAFPMPVRADIFKEIQLEKGLTKFIKYSKIDNVSDEVLLEIYKEINE